ncbi:MAG: DUF58 domain-containing protein, partial [Gemmatimonadales bacterium]|nr:DUF58 domain-containing protein [Gemmatimonadales bacterium]
SARTGSLMVREFEREHIEGFNVVLDTSCSPGEGSAETRAFELAVSYAATLVHHTSAQGRRVCLVTWPASELVLTADGSRGADALLAHLAVAEPRVGRFG